MTSLLVQALAALFVTAMLSRKLNGSVVGGATAFWISWVMLFAAALASSALGVQTEPPEIALTYAQEGVVGAVLGSLLGVWLAGNARAALSGSQRWSEFAQVCEYILCRFTRPVVVVMLICGVAHFAQQWERIDYDIFRLLEMREAVLNERDHGVLYRVTSYMQLLTGFMAMLAGTADAEYGVRARRLALMWLSLAIPGLALGGRGWTLAPQMIYLFAHVISRQCASKRRPGIRAYFPVMALIAAGFWAFTVIGTVRNRNLNRDQAEMLEVSNWDLEQKMMAVSYLGGSLSALGTIGKAAEQIGPSYGEATFDYFSRKATAFNWPYGEKAAQLERWRTSDMPSESEFGWTWCVPPTAMAYLLLDFGRAGMPIALGLLVAIGHWLSVRWIGQGLFRHMVAILTLNAMFGSSQTLAVLNPLNVAVLFFAAVAALSIRPLVKQLRRQANSQSTRTELQFGATGA